MLILGNLKREFYEVFLARVKSPTQIAKAVRVLYLQPGDLHSKNIGLSPSLKSEHAVYQTARFTYNGTVNASLLTLLHDFITSKITSQTGLLVRYAKGSKSDTIERHPALLDLLECDWSLHFFDSDYSLFETNGLLVKNQNTTLAPVRFCLVETEFANKPFNNTIFNMLREDVNKMDDALRFLKNNDHPLFRRMSAEEKQNFRSLIDHELTPYSLGPVFLKPNDNLRSLRTRFADKLAADNNHEIWGIIDKALNTWTSPPDRLTTPARIAQEQCVMLEELYQYNPEFTAENDLILPGTRIELPRHYIVGAHPITWQQIATLKSTPLQDLLAYNQPNQFPLDEPLPQGFLVKIPIIQLPLMKHKRNTLARQLFPKATITQQKAFTERLLRQRDYFDLILTISKFDCQAHTLDEIVHYFLHLIANPSLPLSTVERRGFDAFLRGTADVNNDDLEKKKIINKFLKNFYSAITPTLKNMVKILYPITRELLELSEFALERAHLPDISIPVEKVLLRAEAKMKTNECTFSYSFIQEALQCATCI